MNQESSQSFIVKRILVGILFSMVSAFLLFLVLSLLLSYTEVQEEHIAWSVILVPIVSVFFSSLYSAKGALRGGLLIGGGIGLGFIVLSFLAGGLLMQEIQLTLENFGFKDVMIFVGAGIGGVVGINWKSGKVKRL